MNVYRKDLEGHQGKVGESGLSSLKLYSYNSVAGRNRFRSEMRRPQNLRLPTLQKWAIFVAHGRLLKSGWRDGRANLLAVKAPPLSNGHVFIIRWGRTSLLAMEPLPLS